MLAIRVPSKASPAEPHPLFSPTHASPTYLSLEDSLNSPSIPRAVRNTLLAPDATDISAPFAVLAPIYHPCDLASAQRFCPLRSRSRRLTLGDSGRTRRFGGMAAVHRHPNAIPSFMVTDHTDVALEVDEHHSGGTTPRAGAGSGLERTPVPTPRTARPGEE